MIIIIIIIKELYPIPSVGILASVIFTTTITTTTTTTYLVISKTTTIYIHTIWWYELRLT